MGQKEHGTADTSDAGCGFDDLECRAQHVAGGVSCSGELSVGFSALDNHATIVERVGHLLAGFLDRHAFLLAKFKEHLCILLALLAVLRVDESGF